MDELILQTRLLGVSIEGYFQRFGKFSTQDGIRKVDEKQFRDAVANLDGMELIKQQPRLADDLFRAIIDAFDFLNNTNKSIPMHEYNEGLLSGNNSFDRHSSPDRGVAFEKGGVTKLTLEQLGQIVYYNSGVDLERVEAEALEDLHTVLLDHRLLDKLPDLVTFMNWDRDSSSTIDQFKSLLFETMELSGKIGAQQLGLLLQRYRQDAYSAAKSQSRELAGHGDKSQLEIIKKGYSAAGKQNIQILGIYDDLGYQQRKIGIKDQWASKIAEDIVKGYQVYLIQNLELPMTDYDAPGQMQSYFIRTCQSQAGTGMFTSENLKNILIQIQLYDNEQYSSKDFTNFFSLASRPEVGENVHQPNTHEKNNLKKEDYIRPEQFVSAFNFLSKKPLSTLYQEIIDKFYVNSKRQNISI